MKKLLRPAHGLSVLACAAIVLIANSFEIGTSGIPKYSIKRTAYFPSEVQVENGCLLKNVLALCTDGKRYICVADWNYVTVHKFDLAGELVGFFGKKGQGPGEFQSINRLAAFSQGLVLVDAGNMRITLTDNDGKVIDAFKIFKAYTGVAASLDGTLIYATPQGHQANLIDVLARNGKLTTSFGEQISFKNKHSALNTTFLQRNPSGEIWVAWKYFPIVRRYKSNGELLAEFTIQDESLSGFVRRNQSAGDSIQGGSKITLMGIINGFFVSDSHFYVFLYGKDAKPRIAEFSFLGLPEATYEIEDDVEKEIFVDLVVHGLNKDKAFYILQGYPEARVDIFRIVTTF